MSNSPSTLDSRPATGSARKTTDHLFDLADSAGGVVRRPFQFAGFWSAIGLPFVYMPMLAGGLAASEQSVFAVLLAVHALALVAGHDYHND